MGPKQHLRPDAASLLQFYGYFGEPAPDRRLRRGVQSRTQPPFQCSGMLSALLQEREAAPGQRPLQHPPMHGMWRHLDGAVAFQVPDDDADGLRREYRNAGEIGARESRIGLQHGQHKELRWRGAQFRERAFQRQPRGGCGLPQKIAEIALFATLALAGRRQAHAVGS